jgi:hypothetical protein
MNSSQLNYFLLPSLLRVFPGARYILPIRDPVEWVNSFINHQMSRPLRDEFSEETAAWWHRYRDFRFRSNAKISHPPEEKVLEEHGLYTLDGYLSYWAKHNKQVISSIPSAQLLIIRTSDIDESLSRIARFLDIPLSSLSRSKSHANQARKRVDLIDHIDSEYVDRMIDRHCRSIVDRLFTDSREGDEHILLIAKPGVRVISTLKMICPKRVYF